MGLFKKKDEGGKHLTEEQKERRFYKKLAATLATTTKQLIWVYAFFGVVWISCSYILAFMGKEQIAESLSSTVGEVVVGTMVAYLVTSTVENVAKYSGFPWEPKNRINHEGGNYNGYNRNESGDGSDDERDPATIGPDEQ